jgi:hypothetical protein
MMKGLGSRLDRLEASRPPLDTEGERIFWRCVAENEAAFRPEQVNLTLEQRLKLPLASHYAWHRRFADEADLDAVARLHGWYDAPNDYISFLAATWVLLPGDWPNWRYPELRL